MGDESSGPGGPHRAGTKTVGVLPRIAVVVGVSLGAWWLTMGRAPKAPPTSAVSPPPATSPLAATTPVTVPPPVDSAGVRAGMFAFELAVFHVAQRPPAAYEALTTQLAAASLPVGHPRATTPESPPSVFLTSLPHQRFDVPLPKPLVFAKPEPSRAEIDAILDPRAATKMSFEGPTTAAPKVYRAALSAAQKLEAAAPGVIWDDTSQRMFTRKAWAVRLEGWTGEIPDVAEHVRVESSGSAGDTGRLTTRGMAKLGLPDVVVNEVVAKQRERLTSLVVVVAQALVEGGLPPGGADLEVEIAALRNVAARDRFSRGLAAGAKRTKLAVVLGRVSDAENAFVEVSFPGAQGSLAVRQQRVLDDVFGSEAPVRVAPAAASTPN